MKQIKILFLLVSLIVFSCINQENRTPQKITYSIAGLQIDANTPVLEFTDQWGSITGDGETMIVFKILPSQISEIKDSCIVKRFKIMPISDQLPDNKIYKYLNPFDSVGYYRLSIDPIDARNYSITIFCEESNKLIVYNVIY